MCRRLTCFVLLLAFGLSVNVASGQSTVVRVNFQSNSQGSREVPVGYLPDYGNVFGDRGNGWSYGWSVDKTGSARDRDHSRSPDQRYDTLNDMVHWQTGTGYWEIALPNGTYNLYIVGGDPGYLDQTNSYDVEGTILTDLTPQPQLPYWDEYKVTVDVADGRLTITVAPGADPKICFIHIADVNVAQPISPPDRSLWPSRTPLLQWTPGAKAVRHDVYIGEDFNNVRDATTSTTAIYKGRQDPNSYSATSLTPGATYYWRIDEVNGVNIWKGDIWFFKVQLLNAYDPQPFDNEIFVDPNVVLGWSKGATAANHLVYFGDNYNSVRDATTSSPEFKATLPVGTTTWDPPGMLSLNKTYYWRIDEKESGVTVYKGNVWSFTTATRLGGALKGQYYNNSTFTEPPTLTRIDRQINFDWGLGSPDPNITNVDAFSVRWTGQLEIPASGEWTFWGQVEHGARLWVNEQLLFDVNPGIITWYSATITLEAGFYPIVMEYYETGNIALVKLLWQGPLVPIRQIIPAGAFGLPLTATNPNPAKGATDVEDLIPTLSWIPGSKAAKHDVYFSDNFDDVNSATTSSPPTIYKGRFDPNKYDITTDLNWGQTYYWRIDEVNGTDIWRGSIWSFTVRNYLVVDDFESYNNTSNIISNTWIKGGGGTVGYPDPNYAELIIVNGGAQSMPVDYNNTKTPYYSEATRTFDTPQNWTASGPYSLKALTLWFRGYPVSVGSFVESPVGTYTITASGTDIWDVSPTRGGGYHDEFHFGYKEVTAADAEGLVTIVAKVESITNTNASAKAGVMIRDSLDPNSTHGIMCVMPDPCVGDAFQYRLTTGGASGSTGTVGIATPYWVKLVLDAIPSHGNIRAYHSPTGAEGSWTQVGEGSQQISTMTLPRSSPLYVGLAVTAHNASATCTAVFSNVTITVGAAGAWKHQDIGIKSNVAAPLYVTLQDSNPSPGTKTVTHWDPNILLQNTWQAWDIPLSDFTGVALTKIEKITIGVGSGSADGTGTIYVDDIRVYISRCIPDRLRSAADFTGSDCIVDHLDLQILTNNWLISEYQVTPPVGWDPNTDPNLAGYYKFDGNFNDSSGKGNDGDPTDPNVATIVNDATRGQVASFDGVNDYVNCSNDVSLDITGKVTLSLWVKTNDSGNSQDNEWVAKGDHTYGIKHKNNNNIEFFIYDGAWYTAWYAVDSSFNGVWRHVAGTYDGSALKLYVDGMLQATTAHVGSIETRTHNLYMGQNSEVTGRFYAGAMDDVRIYSRALSQGEVAYLAGKTEPFIQPLELLLTPQDSAINLYNDGTIDLRDYAGLADTWLEKLLWP